MTSARPIQRNGDKGDQEVRDELDQVVRVLESSSGNRLLDEVNLGLGNYDQSRFYQQVESYRKGLVADTAFGSLITQRAIDDTKRTLAREGIAFYDTDRNEPVEYAPLDEDDIDESESTWTAERRRGNEIWDELGIPEEPITEKQFAAIVKATGLEPGGWMPIFWDMLIGKHDMSRSIDAELLRDYLTEMRTLRDELSDEESAGKLLKR